MNVGPRPIRGRRVFRRRMNDDEDLSEEKFRERFRLSKEVVRRIVAVATPDIRHDTGKNGALSPMQQVLLALRFMATGTFYHAVGDAHGPSKATVCRVIRRVTASIVARLGGILSFPVGHEACRRTQDAFYDIAGMPSVIGCIDGTHINIWVPSEEEDHYINRHQQKSINMMAVAGPDGRLFCVSVHAGGRQHDSRVLATSRLPERFERGEVVPLLGAVMLGDSAYASKTWLLTPIDQSANDAERRYNIAHAKTRATVEMAFGQLKMRWPCLRGAGLRLRSIALSAQTIMACCILHNVAKMTGDGDEWPGEDHLPVNNMAPDDLAERDAIAAETVAAARRRAFARRAQFVRLFAGAE